jgi:hypothetical protein
MLFSWGPLQFDVHPLNTHEWEQLTGSEYARKEVAGILPPREFVGEDDEEIYLRGRVFPMRIGGLSELEALETMRRKSIAHLLARGDGFSHGWFVLERLLRAHRFLLANGVGQQIDFEGVFIRVPTPNGADYIANLLAILR